LDARPRWLINTWQVGMILSALVGFGAAGFVVRTILGGLQPPAPAVWFYGLAGIVGLGAFVVGVVFGVRDARVWSRRGGAVDVLVWAGIGVLLGLPIFLAFAFFGDPALDVVVP
jgi:hypothetical protein